MSEAAQQKEPLPQSILIVDDTPENLRLLVSIFKGRSYSVRPVRDGRTALSSALSQPPDVILLDILMPDPDGYEVCRQLKADERTRDIPVIFISALSEVFDKVKAFSLGGVDFITKPFQAQEVLARVETHLTNHLLRRQLKEQNLRLKHEVSVRAQMEDALNKSRRLLKRVFASLEEAVLVVDRQSRTVALANPALEKIFGYTQQDVLGKGFDFLYMSPEEFELFEGDILNALEAGETFYAEAQMRRKDGSMFICEHRAAAIPDAKDQIVAIIHIIRDITERKLSEKALQHHNQELLLMNRIGHLVSSSLELHQVLEIALKEIQRRLKVASASFWLRVPETQDLQCMHAIGPGRDYLTQQCLAPGQGITGWVVQHGKSANVADVKEDARHFAGIDLLTGVTVHSILSVPLRIKGDAIGALNLTDSERAHFSTQDLQFVELIASTVAIAIENARLYTTAQQEIAERKQAEEALREANDSKDKFFSIISHDLRSPFSVLLGYTEVMHSYFEEYSPEKLKEEIKRVYLTAEKMYALLENLLTWSRVQRGAMQFEPERLELQEIVEDCLDLFLSKSEQKELRLKSSVPDGLCVWGDHNMLKTIIRNLISNALKFTMAGGEISISARQNAEQVEVAVSDTGLGIAAADLDKLFRIDVQFSETGTDGEKGTGLGLNLCYDLVQRNGGDIRVESEIGKGTVFRFTLPTAQYSGQ